MVSPLPLLFFINLFIFILCALLSHLSVCLCENVVNCHVGGGNWSWVLRKCSKCSQPVTHLTKPHLPVSWTSVSGNSSVLNSRWTHPLPHPYECWGYRQNPPPPAHVLGLQAKSTTFGSWPPDVFIKNDFSIGPGCLLGQVLPLGIFVSKALLTTILTPSFLLWLHQKFVILAKIQPVVNWFGD